MKKIYKLATCALVVCFVMMSLVGCSQKIDNVKFINATYGINIESKIYPSTLNAAELEQVYKRWDIVFERSMDVYGVTFSATPAPNEKTTADTKLYVVVSKINGDAAVWKLDRTEVDLQGGEVKIDFSGDTKFADGDILRLSFYDANSDNSTLSFKIEQLKFQLDI